MVGRVRKVVQDTKGNIKPLSDRLLVKIEAKPLHKETEGGILLPQTFEEDRVSTKAVVKAKGPGHENREGKFTPLAVELNDAILIGKYAGVEVKIHGEEFRIIHFADILVILGQEELTVSQEAFVEQLKD
jgi:chaperonin GroES